MFRLSIVLMALVTGACASTGATPQPFPGAAKRAPDVREISPSSARAGYAIAGTALSLRGIPYRNGGADPNGFDCSGFVRYVFEQHGVSVPRSVGEQFRAGQAVAADTIEAGDLLFFSTTAPAASHVGIAIGGDEFIHAPSTSGVVRVERLAGSYWAPRFVGARRLRI